MMKKQNYAAACTVVLLSIVVLFSYAQAQKPYDELTFPKLRDIKMPEITKKTLPNGMRLFLIEDHDFPIISIRARVKTGSIYEPAEKIGLASLTGSVMRTGGTESTPGDDLDEQLENIAASVEVSIGTGSGSASMFCLKENLQEVLEIYADVLMHPAFAEDKIELAKIQARTGISRRNDNIMAIASREYAKIIYGADSPYARTVEYATVDNISREDMIAFHRNYFRPNNMLIGVTGDFDTDSIVDMIKNAFKDWQKTDIDFPPKPKISYEFKPGIYLVDKKDAVQTNIALGHIGGTRDNPDFFAITVLNSILGGGFSSRLFTRVRTQEGLAYSVRGSYGFGYDRPGMFSAGCQTKTETTVRAIQTIIEEIERLTKEPVTPEELNLAKEGFLNSFVFNFDTKDEILNRLLTYNYYGYPEDFIMQIKENVEKTTAEDVLRVAKKYLRYETVRILAVGNAEQFDQPLSLFGQVIPVDITIPTPKKEPEPAATAESVEKEKKLFDKMVQALAGKEAIDKIKNSVISAKITADTPMGEQVIDAVTTIEYPDKIHQEIQVQGMTINQVINGTQGQMTGMGQTQNLPSSRVNEFQNAFMRNPVWLAQNVESLVFQFLEEAAIDGVPVAKVRIKSEDGRTSTVAIDTESWLPNRFYYETVSQGGPAEEVSILSDFHTVDGFRFAFKRVVMKGDQRTQEVIISDIKINQSLDPDLFQIK